MARKRPAALVVLSLALVAAAILTFVWYSNPAPDWTRPAPYPAAYESHARGGTIRVGVSTLPEMSDEGTGGDTLRQLTLPKLFVAQPDGSWNASLVVPGSDHAARDGMSASFKLRSQEWSDRTPVTAADLERTADRRYVEDVEGPDKDGKIKVDFTQKLPGWRQLWSGTSSVSGARPDMTSGPFRVSEVTPGLETVLVRDDRWRADDPTKQPTIDELRLVVVPDAVMATQLLKANRLDVLVPPADSGRINELRRDRNLAVDVADQGGTWTGLRIDRSISGERRSVVAAALARTEFTEALLPNEADVLDGFASPAGWKDGSRTNDGRLDNVEFDLTIPVEQPMASVFAKSVTSVLKERGGSVSVRSVGESEAQQLEDDGGYELLLVGGVTGPDVCWQCVYSESDQRLGQLADTGAGEAGAKLESAVRDEATFVPLWRAKVVAASRDDSVRGVVANGFASGAAWNAERWWKP